MTEILERPAIELGPTSTRRGGRSPGSPALLAAPVGILLLVAVTLAGGEPPAGDAPAREVVAHYADDGVQVLLGFAGLAGALLLGVAGAAFASLLRAAGDASAWPRLALVGGAVAAVAFATNANLLLLLTDTGAASAGAVEAVNALNDGLFMPGLAGIALLLGGVAASARRTALLPGWATGLGVGLACLAPFGPGGFATYVLGSAWLAVAGVVLARRP